MCPSYLTLSSILRRLGWDISHVDTVDVECIWLSSGLRCILLCMRFLFRILPLRDHSFRVWLQFVMIVIRLWVCDEFWTRLEHVIAHYVLSHAFFYTNIDQLNHMALNCLSSCLDAGSSSQWQNSIAFLRLKILRQSHFLTDLFKPCSDFQFPPLSLLINSYQLPYLDLQINNCLKSLISKRIIQRELNELKFFNWKFSAFQRLPHYPLQNGDDN